MYEEEKRKQDNAQRRSRVRGGMTKKWTHLEFVTVFPGQTAAHLSTIGELDDRSIDSARSFSSFASVDKAQLEEDIDLDCDTGRANYLMNKSTAHMMKKTMESNKPWPWRYDGLRHASLPVTKSSCQYCRFQFLHEFDDN